MTNRQVFVSSSCVNNTNIGESVLALAKAGYKNIELSGGTNLYDHWKRDLLELQKDFELNYRCHNYFPPPAEHFVLNLSASNEEIRRRSIAHVKEAITLSRQLSATEYGIHAGFRFMPEHKRLGKKFDAVPLQSEDTAIELFASAWEELYSHAYDEGIKLYVENNVFSKANSVSFDCENPFLATDSKSIKKLSQVCQLNLLLDIAHLKVSCNTLGISFEEEFSILIPQSDYLHFSDNNGIADTNNGLHKDSDMFEMLRRYDLRGKTITLEVYDGTLEESRTSVSLLKL